MMRFEPYPSGRGVIRAEYEPTVDPELKPCPFCGGSDLEVANTHTASYWVECMCGAQRGGTPQNGRSRRSHRLAFLDAINAWNERAPATPEVKP
jgi:glutathione S-transferase